MTSIDIKVYDFCLLMKQIITHKDELPKDEYETGLIKGFKAIEGTYFKRGLDDNEYVYGRIEIENIPNTLFGHCFEIDLKKTDKGLLPEKLKQIY